ncbi:Transcription antitermination protein RfaH [compost metagenome]
MALDTQSRNGQAAEVVTAGYVVAAPSSMSGWGVVGEPFYSDVSLARIASVRVPNAVVLPAMLYRESEIRRGRHVETYSVEVDWSACVAPLRRRSERWYAVRVTPGLQKMAAAIEAPKDETERGQAERFSRRGETIVERNLREAGIDVYMPAFWQEVRKHRSRKLVERRYPLLVGYAFIRRDPGLGFDPVRDVDGVSCVVRTSEAAGPAEFREEDIRMIMVEMFKRELRYRYDRFNAIENARHQRTKGLYADLGRMLPKGRSRTESLRSHADRMIRSLAEGKKARVLGILAQLNELDEDSSLDKFRAAI